MYVAATRAKKRLFLTYAKSRFLYGETKFCIPSRFLRECGLVDEREATELKREAARQYEASFGYGTYGGRSDGAYSSGRKYGYSERAERPISSGAAPKSEYKSGFGLNEPKRQPDGMGDKIAVGCTVMHKRLGKGKVIGLEKTGNSIYAKIDFERGGVMLLAVDFAPITVVED